MLPAPAPRERGVPWRTIWGTIAAVLITLLGLLLLRELSRVVAWVVVAVFFTVVLTPAVDFLQHRGRLRRGLAATIVFLLGFALLGGMLYSFIRPVVDQATEFVEDLPEYIEDAQEGRGAIGRLIERYDLQETVE